MCAASERHACCIDLSHAPDVPGHTNRGDAIAPDTKEQFAMLKSTAYGRTFALSMIVAVAAIGLGSVAHAAKPEKKQLNAKEMTCQDFLALGTEEQPRVVYWLDGYSKSGKLESEDIDIDAFERPVAMVVTECTKAPKASLMDKIKAYF